MSDAFCIFAAFLVATILKNFIAPAFDFIASSHSDANDYTEFWLIYAVLLAILFYQKIYTKRYDFWHESLIVLRSCVLACVLIFCFLALGQDLTHSRAIIIGGFALAALFIPINKYFLKKILYRLGIWQKRAIAINATRDFRREIFKNHYLGYKLVRGENYETIFIQNRELSVSELDALVEKNIVSNREIIFTPALEGYDFSRAEIFSLFNSRTNLFMLENSLLNPVNRILKLALDYIIVLCALPFLALAFLGIFIAMKMEEPKGKILFSQPRAGLGGKAFNCFKFRSMRENGDEILREYLSKYPEERAYFNEFHKYRDDPRITRVGNFLRKTSLDELPQLLNVIRGEMSIVGPRPFVVGEREAGGVSASDMKILLAVKPGVTGLAQVMGRGNTSFKKRVQMDIWYVKNWSVYTDIVIILKTIKSVLKREGAS